MRWASGFRWKFQVYYKFTFCLPKWIVWVVPHIESYYIFKSKLCPANNLMKHFRQLWPTKGNRNVSDLFRLQLICFWFMNVVFVFVWRKYCYIKEGKYKISIVRNIRMKNDNNQKWLWGISNNEQKPSTMLEKVHHRWPLRKGIAAKKRRGKKKKQVEISIRPNSSYGTYSYAYSLPSPISADWLLSQFWVCLYTNGSSFKCLEAVLWSLNHGLANKRQPHSWPSGMGWDIEARA